jgi:hypothetical protein
MVYGLKARKKMGRRRSKAESNGQSIGLSITNLLAAKRLVEKSGESHRLAKRSMHWQKLQRGAIRKNTLAPRESLERGTCPSPTLPRPPTSPDITTG